MAREVWFQLVDEESHDAFAGTLAASVRSDAGHGGGNDEDDVEDFRSKVHAEFDHTRPPGRDLLAHIAPMRLKVYADRAAFDDKQTDPLEGDSLIGAPGGSEKDALIVVVPMERRVAPTPAYGVWGLRIVLPHTTALDEPERFAEECISLMEWEVGVVHQIPKIWQFMSRLGGCTTHRASLYWRTEDKQVVSMLVDGWFHQSSVHANKKSILVGSPGIGKSTLLCIMPFYLVFKHKKNVLLYRYQENCLLYLGYEHGKVVQFALERCKTVDAIHIYEELIHQHGIANVWLLLDGFLYREIPEGIRTFRMLATLPPVYLKSHEFDDAYCCTASCWSKKDLFTLGRKVYGFEELDMEQRFVYSGGSVREFGCA